MSVRFQFWLAFIMLILYVPDSAAWGPQGHRVIGFIADSHLSPEVKKIIAEKFNINSLANVATWADRTRKKEKKKVLGIIPILLKGSGLTMLQGIAQTKLVLQRKFRSFRILWLILRFLFLKGKMR